MAMLTASSPDVPAWTFSSGGDRRPAGGGAVGSGSGGLGLPPRSAAQVDPPCCDLGRAGDLQSAGLLAIGKPALQVRSRGPIAISALR